MATDIIIGLGIIIFALLYIAFNVDEEHFLIKLLSYIFALGFMFLIPNGAAYGATSAVITNLIKMTTIYFTLTTTYILVYLLYHYLMRFRSDSLR